MFASPLSTSDSNLFLTQVVHIAQELGLVAARVALENPVVCDVHIAGAALAIQLFRQRLPKSIQQRPLARPCDIVSLYDMVSSCASQLLQRAAEINICRMTAQGTVPAAGRQLCKNKSAGTHRYAAPTVPAAAPVSAVPGCAPGLSGCAAPRPPSAVSVVQGHAPPRTSQPLSCSW